MEIVLTLPRPPLAPVLRGAQGWEWSGGARRAHVPRAGAEAAHDPAGEARDPVAEAVARLLSLSGGRPGIPPAVAEGPDAARLVYDRAASAVERDEIGAAVALLHGLLASEAARPEALMGLAVCAARLSLFDEALVLVIESRRLGVDHPRAWCVAGLCELKRDQQRTARTYLAAAARSARRSPEFGDDLRAAQRLLLLMHMAQEDPAQEEPVQHGATPDDLGRGFPPVPDPATQDVAAVRPASGGSPR